jgi:hypothetical protein
LRAAFRVWLATGHTDMRKGFDTLALLVIHNLQLDRNPHFAGYQPGVRGNPAQVALTGSATDSRQQTAMIGA